MKSFVSDAISRVGAQGGQISPPYQGYSSEDQDLVKILESLKTNIKIDRLRWRRDEHYRQAFRGGYRRCRSLCGEHRCPTSFSG